MMIDQDDKKYFQTLGLRNFIDLALLIPSKFENTTITKSPEKGEVVVEIVCKGLQMKPKFLEASVFCETWGLNLKMIIFNPKKYHFGIFAPNQKHFVKAKAEYYINSWQLLQPLVITKINQILPKFKAKIKDLVIERLTKKYLNESNLKFEGLNENEIKAFLELHLYDEVSVKMLESPHFENEFLKILKFSEIYSFLKKLSKKKVEFKAISKLNSSVDEFVKNLPFKLTDDQKDALQDIQKDLNSNIAARRIIMGDVGSGKTILILASAVIAMPEKSVLMVPTTILAEQIYLEAKKLLPKNIKSILLTSNSKEENLENFDFLIGTHALLYQNLPVCALVMIDEQHRFGSNQRKLIEQLTQSGEKKPHFLQFSATPIPRTLSMIHSSIVSYSFLKQMPYKKEIETKIISNSGFKDMLKELKNEIDKKNQAIIIYPLVKESEFLNYQSLELGESFWRKNFDNVYVTHGKDKQKEQVLLEFREKGSILLATTVVEVGISLPKLSFMVIVGAERLGLATLHQLRGRLSRVGLKGFCYLFTRFQNTQRLEEFARTNDGFKIAELDLRYRKSGDLLEGITQHGQSMRWFDYAKDEDILKAAKERLML